MVSTVENQQTSPSIRRYWKILSVWLLLTKTPLSYDGHVSDTTWDDSDLNESMYSTPTGSAVLKTDDDCSQKSRVVRKFIHASKQKKNSVSECYIIHGFVFLKRFQLAHLFN